MVHFLTVEIMFEYLQSMTYLTMWFMYLFSVISFGVRRPSSHVVENAEDSKQQVSRVKLALSSSGFLQAAISQRRLLVIPPASPDVCGSI